MFVPVLTLLKTPAARTTSRADSTSRFPSWVKETAWVERCRSFDARCLLEPRDCFGDAGRRHPELPAGFGQRAGINDRDEAA